MDFELVNQQLMRRENANPFTVMQRSIQKNTSGWDIIQNLLLGTQRGVSGAISSAIDVGQGYEVNPLERILKSMSGEVPIGTSEILSQLGMKEPSALKTGLSFAGDIISDPLTYAGGTLGKLAISGFSKLNKELGLAEKFRNLPGATAFVSNLPKTYHELKEGKKWQTSSQLKNYMKELEGINKGLKESDLELLYHAKEHPELRAALTPFQQRKLEDMSNSFNRLGQQAVDKGYIKQEEFDTMKDTYIYHLYPDIKGVSASPNIFNKINTTPSFAKKREFQTAEDAFSYSNKFKEISEAPDLISMQKLIKTHGVDNEFLGYTNYEDIKALALVNENKYKVNLNPLLSLGHRMIEQNNAIMRDGLINETLSSMGRKLPVGAKNVLPNEKLYAPLGHLKFFIQPYVDVLEHTNVLRKYETEILGMGDKITDGLKAEENIRMVLYDSGFSSDNITNLINKVRLNGEQAISDLLFSSRGLAGEWESLAKNNTSGLIDAIKLPTQIRNIMGVTKQVNLYALDKNIARDLDKMDITGLDPNIKGIIGILLKGQNFWKNMVTCVNLPFHVRNLQSNLYNCYIGGVNPLRLPNLLNQSVSILNNTAKNVLVKGKNITIADFKKQLSDNGITGGGFLALDTPNAVLSELDRALGLTFKGKYYKLNPIHWGQQMGVATEDATRIALYLDRLNKGDSIFDAALHVKKYLFDYADLTDTERTVLKQVIPFYTWMRKNIPLQIESLFTQPQKVGQVLHARENLIKYGGETPEERASLPSYFDHLMYIKSRFKSAKGSSYYYSVNLPIDDLPKLAELKQTFFSCLSPYVGLTASMMNTKIFPIAGQKFKDKLVPAPWYVAGLDNFAPEISKALGMQIYPDPDKPENKILGMSERGKYWLSMIFPPLQRLEFTMPITVQMEDKAPAQMISYLTGVGITNVNYDKMRYNKAMSNMQAMNKLKIKHKQTQTPISLEEILSVQ